MTPEFRVTGVGKSITTNTVTPSVCVQILASIREVVLEQPLHRHTDRILIALAVYFVTSLLLTVHNIHKNDNEIERN